MSGGSRRDEDGGGLPAAMVEVGRSMLRLSWAMAVFSAQQAVNLVAGGVAGGDRPKASDAFDAVSHAVEDEVRGVFRGAHRTGRDWIPGLGPRGGKRP